MKIASDIAREVEHPLITHFLTVMRDRRCPPLQYQNSLHQLASILALKAMREFPAPTQPHRAIVSDTNSEFEGTLIASDKIVLVAILRGGIIMSSSINGLLPASPVVHAYVHRNRDENIAEVDYCPLPNVPEGVQYWVLDTIISTGKSMSSVIRYLINKAGVVQQDIMILNIVAAPEGIATIHEEFPKVKIVTCSIESGLDARKETVPGIGNSGARLYQTIDSKAIGTDQATKGRA